MAAKIVAVLFVSLWMNTLLFGGDKEGNGGDVVVCSQEGGVQTLELLDYFEARTLMVGVIPDLGPASLSVREKIERVLERLAVIDPARREDWTKRVDDFYARVLFLPNYTFPDLADQGQVLIPNHCELKQIAIQKLSDLPEERRYFIAKDLWDKLSDEDRAGLILHEVIYGEAIELYGHGSSKSARYFNALLSTPQKIETMNQKEYIGHLLRTEYRRWVYKNFSLRIDSSSPRFYSNGQIKYAGLFTPTKIISNSVELVVEGSVTFYPSGQLFTTNSHTFPGFDYGPIWIGGPGAHLFFDEGGWLKSALSGPSKFIYSMIQGKRVDTDHVFLDSNKKVKCAWVKPAVELRNTKNELETFQDCRLEFDENELARRVPTCPYPEYPPEDT